MKKVTLIAMVAVVTCSFFGARVYSQGPSTKDKTPDPFHRHIYVPFESLDILLDGNSNRVLLTRAEYDALLKSARTREIKRAPLDSAIVSAQYTGEISEGVALIKGVLIVEPLNEGLVQIPLPFSGVAIRNATLGDQPAKLWRNEKGQIVLLMTSNSRETLNVEMTVPMQTSAARQSMSIQLPSPSATRFNLTVPGNVEVKSGIPVANRVYDADKNTTEFDLLATRESMTIVMSLNNRLLKDERVAVSRSVMIHKLTPHTQEMHVTCSMDVIHGALEEVEFNVPMGFQVSQVSTELLSQWEIKDPPQGAEDLGKRLVVKLRQPTREDFVLNITAARNAGAVGDWKAEDIRPIDVAGHVSVVGVLADIELESAKLVSKGVIPIDHEFLMAALPKSIQSTNGGNPATIVAAFYAPQKEYSISSSFSLPAPELIVKSNSRLVIDNQMLELQGGISLISRHDSRFDFKMTLPKSWRLNELTGIDGKPIRFDRVGVDGSSDFLIHLPARIPSTSSARVFFKASLTPAGWLEKWESNKIEFPSLEISGETKHTGAIAISTDEDLAIKPVNLLNLELLDETDKSKFGFDRYNAPLAYQFEKSDFRLSLELERLKPSIMARTYNFVTVMPTQLIVHSELVFDIKQASEGEFEFELPLDSPKSISIRSTSDQLKDYRSEETETTRRWIVQLAKPQKGQVHLLIDFQMPLEESQLAELKLAPVVVRNVSFQSSMFAVEGSTELDIEIETEARAVDVGEFSQSVYQPGRHLLGTYSWPNEKMSLTVKSLRRPVYQLPSAIVQRAEMVTSISNNGKAQTAARFQLVTKQQPFLRVELPKNATLWSVQLDGQPAKPQLQNDALLISLIGNETGKLRDLQLVFESPASSFSFVGKIQAHAPTLWLNEAGNEQGIPVPLVDLHWRLIMPEGFSISHGDGKFQSDQLVKRPSPIQQLGSWVYRLGGGIGYASHKNFKTMVSQNTVSNDAAEWSNLALGDDEGWTFFTPSRNLEDEMFDDDDEEAEVEDSKEKAPPLAAKPQINQPKDSAPRPPAADQLVPSGELGRGEAAFAPAETPIQLDGKRDDEKYGKSWALSGLRSLNIELTDTGNSIEFYNLGEQPTLTATIINQSRLNWIAIALALLIAAMGVLLTNRQLKLKITFVMLVLLIACVAPLAGVAFDAFRTIIDLAILAAVFVAIYFVVAGLIKLMSRSISMVAARIPLFLLLVAISIGFGNQAKGQQVVNDASQLKRLIEELQTEPHVNLPNDAIIIPFDADDPKGRENADRLLVPYEHYLKLINKADIGTQPMEINAPVNFVLSSAEYNVQLTLDEDISIQGKLVIELLTDDPVSVALPLFGGALADAQVDGKPAKLQFQPVTNTKKAAPQKGATSNSSIVQLHLEGRGSKTFEFTVRIKPARQGGWRMLNARLPVGLTRELNLTSLKELTEIRLNSDSDRRSIEAKSNQEIATVLSADGSLRLQWKPSTATQTIDQSLTAKSEAIFDVREDGLRLNWRVDLDFRGSERDVFTLNLPDGFLVEQVSGENVRAWDVKKDGDASRLNVTTLSPAKDKESFTIELSRRDFAVVEAANQFDAPYLTVEGAALHKGVYTIRRSPIIDLKTTKQQAASRIDANQTQMRIDVARIDSKSSPLGIEAFQVLQFVTTPFQIGMQASLVPRTIKAETQSILRIGQSEADLEMRINVAVGKRPIYKLSFDIPLDAEIRSLSAGLKETWTSEAIDGIQRIQFFFPSGIANDFSIILDAELTEYSGGNEWTIPKVKLNEVAEQNGFIAVQVDPALAVTTNNLENCETVLLQQVEGWLNRNQRSTTRLVLRTKGASYDAKFRFTKIKPRVTVETVTNVRTTLFAIEETILLDFNIQQAGIRQIQFDLPVSMRNARINAKLVSETLIDDVVDNASVVRVTLNLQDEVIDSYRVVIENDRQLSEARQSVPIPRVLTGVTEQRYATLQNAGRDEISVIPSDGFQSLNRQLNQFARLKQKLAGGEVTMAYVAQAKAESPILQYESRQREVFDTVAASIEFSKTTMVVDSSGAYRALQNFQINNRSEQYLEIELPAGAQLLTVLVEGQPVKPVAWPAAQNDRRLRIPLVKTQLGDLDYPVQLKYGGRLGELSTFNEVGFPVIETLNINVQLSQLHLRLPDSYRWMNFGGTMTQVDDRGKLEESYLSYKGRQIQQLAEQIQSKSSFGSFSRARAYSNLNQLQQEMVEFEESNPTILAQSNAQVLDLVQGNNDAILRAQESYSVEISKSGAIVIDNRANFNSLIEKQSARIGRNLINKQAQNFRNAQSGKDVKKMQGEKSIEENARSINVFDSTWLDRNKLSGGQNLSRGQAQQAAQREGKKTDGQLRSPIVTVDEMLVDNSISFFNPRDQLKTAHQQAAGEAGQGPVGGGAGGGGGFGAQDFQKRLAGKAELSGDALADEPIHDLERWDGEPRDPATGPALASGLDRDFGWESGVHGMSLSSLNIELPERGVDFYFKSPRGKATVVVRPVESRSFSRWMSVLITLAICVGVSLICWIAFRLCRNPTFRVVATIALLLTGLISLAFGMLPVYGLLAVIGSIVLFIDRSSQLSRADASAAITQ